MPAWHVRVEFTAAAAFTDEALLDVFERLLNLSPSVAAAQDMSAGSAIVALEADSALEAARAAEGAIVEALRAEGIEPTVVGIESLREDVFDRELARPLFPEVVGFSEVAALAGVSRTRARQFAALPGFPEPVIVTGQGPLMAKAAVERWLSSRNTRPGRPAGAAPTAS